MKFFILLLLFIYLSILLIFFFFQEFFIFHPKKTEASYKYQFPVKFKEKYYDIGNESKLHTLYFSTEKEKKGVVLYLHGNAGSLEEWGWIYTDFLNRGYDLQLLDYRTYGKSTGKLSQKALFSDTQVVYEDLMKAHKESEIILFGRSIGTGIASYTASKNSPKSLILESPYFNLFTVVNKILPILPVRILLKYSLETDKYLKDVDCPVYIMHGVKDDVIPYKNSKQLKSTFPEKIELLTIEAGGHNDLGRFDEYQQFLGKILH